MRISVFWEEKPPRHVGLTGESIPRVIIVESGVHIVRDINWEEELYLMIEKTT